MDNPSETLHALLRGYSIRASTVREFVAELGLTTGTTVPLIALTPACDAGVAESLVREYLA